MKKIVWFTEHEYVPDGAVYLTSQFNGQDHGFHYFLVDDPEKPKTPEFGFRAEEIRFL